MLQGHSSVFQALLGTFFTWGMTAAGAALVFVFSSGQVSCLASVLNVGGEPLGKGTPSYSVEQVCRLFQCPWPYPQALWVCLLSSYFLAFCLPGRENRWLFALDTFMHHHLPS